jgi:hypothetical protein
VKKRNRVFDINLRLTVYEDNNILSAHEEFYMDDMADLVTDTFYDVDDVEVSNISVEQRKRAIDDNKG